MLKEESNLIVNEVTAEKWVYGGDSLSRLNGQVVLTPYLIPGETARVETLPGKRGLMRALPRDIFTPSPARVEPVCPYFYRCGGCHYQHASYELQVQQKSEILREQLRRVGRVVYEGEIVTIASPPLEYRNRSQFHVEHGQIGYYGAGSHELVAIDHCPISSPKINEALGSIRAMMGDRRWPSFVRSIELFTNEKEVMVNILQSDRPVSKRFFDWCAESIPGARLGWLEYSAAGHSFQVSHNSFFQVNRFLVDSLVDAATDGSEGGTALDLYAGVGLFSLALAKRFRSVTAVESGTAASRDLQHNAQLAGLTVDVKQGNVESFLPALTEPPDFVIADPPRTGLGKTVTAELVRLKPARVVIVACDPATLARDLGVLTTQGYRIEKLVMVDLFPQTFHLESVATLSATDKA